MKQTISATEFWRNEKLFKTIELPELSPPDAELLKEFLKHHHDVFSLEDGECGEMNLVYTKFDTRDASPKKHPPRRILLTVNQEVAKQLTNIYVAEWCHPAILLTMV